MRVQQPHRPWPQLSRAPYSANSLRTTSSRVWWLATSALTGSPLSVKLIVRAAILFVLEGLVLKRTERAVDGLGVERQLGDAHAAGVVDRVGDRRTAAEGGGLAHALGAERAVGLHRVDRLVLHHRRHVEDAGDLVVGERGIGDLAAVDVHLLEHGEAELHQG